MHFSKQLLPSRMGNLAVLELNNPESLNALTLDMVRAINSVLPVWQSDDTVKATYVVGAPSGGKTNADRRPTFCAGGDVKSVYESGLLGRVVDEGRRAGGGEKPIGRSAHGRGTKGLLTADFFREEYQMNHLIATQHKSRPQVSVWDGIVMGGGVGLSIHGKYRVATENTTFAMPETAIGFFPDVGGTHWLSRLSGGLGGYVALTGARLKADDLLYAGIATHYVPSEKLTELRKALIQSADDDDGGGGDGDGRDTAGRPKRGTGGEDCVAAVLLSFHEELPRMDSFLSKNRGDIDVAFGGKRTVEEIFDALELLAGADSKFGRDTLQMLAKMSPTSLKVTLEGLRRGEVFDIAECLRMEYRMAQAFMREGSDFYEGIRAMLVDKDRNPKWSPATLEEVSDEMVQSYFQSLGSNELILEETGGVAGGSKL